MGFSRRTVLVGAAVTLAGCSGVSSSGGGQPTDSDPATTTDETPTPTGNSCESAETTRPAVPTDAAVDGRAYPEPPADPTAESVGQFLADFERAVAWNRAVGTRENLTDISVETLDGFAPEAVDDGFLASSGMRLMMAIEREDGRTVTERADYVASYFVGDSVYRVETADRRVDPRESADRQLVACGADTET